MGNLKFLLARGLSLSLGTALLATPALGEQYYYYVPQVQYYYYTVPQVQYYYVIPPTQYYYYPSTRSYQRQPDSSTNRGYESSTTSRSADADQFLSLIKAESPVALITSTLLTNQAQRHAQWLYNTRSTAHSPQAGVTVGEVQQCYAYSARGAMYGDSGAMGFRSSTGHWRIIKSTEYSRVGVGVYGDCYVAQYAR